MAKGRDVIVQSARIIWVRLTSISKHASLSLRQTTRYLPDHAIVGNAEHLAGVCDAAKTLRVGILRFSTLSKSVALFLPK